MPSLQVELLKISPAVHASDISISMSSFKRKITSKQANLPPGTRLSPTSLSTTMTSTGIPSLDDILGGGLPLSCSLLVLAPDSHSAYGELVQKYFIAQGLACGQRVCILDGNAKEFVEECMWMPGSLGHGLPTKSHPVEEEEDEKASQHDDTIKIAWRYEQMKKFQTTVPSSISSMEEYCRTFDLTCRIPHSIIDGALQSGDLICLGVDSTQAITRIIRRIEEILQTWSQVSSIPLRICIPSLGSPQWGDLTPQEILWFLHSLQRLLRQHPLACASLSLSPHICSGVWGGSGWIQKLGWLSDGAFTLSAFTANPSLATIFPTHHGLLDIHTLPAPHTLLPPSDKFSALRGLCSASSTGGGGENNLAFKCMRKRLIFETLHLNLEGGVRERRTTPSTNAMALDIGIQSHDHGHDAERKASDAVVLHVDVQVEVSAEGNKTEMSSVDIKVKKPKKTVAFQSDRPELYDF